MSEAREFFRICPACGRRFHIKLVSKKLVDERRDVEKITQGMVSPMLMGAGGAGFMMPIAPIVVEENVPVTIDIEDFKYAYKCKHCGHTWSESREEEHKE